MSKTGICKSKNTYIKLLKFCLFICIFMTSNCTFAHILYKSDNDRIVVEGDSIAHLGKYYRIQYEYNCKDSLEEIISPQWNWEKHDYKMIMGPSKKIQTSKSYSLENEIWEEKYCVIYTFYLSFHKVGVYSLPSMTVQLTDGRTIISNPIEVRITEQLPEALLTPENDSLDIVSEPVDSSYVYNISKDNYLAIEAKIDRNVIKLGDSITFEIRLYTAIQVNRIVYSHTLPIDYAYWIEHEQSNEVEFEIVELNGRMLRTALLGKYSIIPLQPGTISIQPMSFKVSYLAEKPDVDEFEAFFNGKYENLDALIKTKAIEFIVESHERPKNNVVLERAVQQHRVGIVIDRSSSLMARKDTLSCTYFELENDFLNRLLKSGKSYYPVTLFARKPHYSTPLEVDNMQNIFPSREKDGSSVYDAILACALREGAMSKNFFPFSIILLTDGSNNASHISESTLINLLLKQKIRVDVIAFSCNKDSVYYNFGDSIGEFKIKNANNLDEVKRIAKYTNGIFLQVDNMDEIPSAIHRLKKNVKKARIPCRRPDKDFEPDDELLYNLYNDIMSEANAVF